MSRRIRQKSIYQPTIEEKTNQISKQTHYRCTTTKPTDIIKNIHVFVKHIGTSICSSNKEIELIYEANILNSLQNDTVTHKQRTPKNSNYIHFFGDI